MINSNSKVRIPYRLKEDLCKRRLFTNYICERKIKNITKYRKNKNYTLKLQCKNGDFIYATEFCNGKYNCKDKSDEEDCLKECNFDKEKQCSNGECIIKENWCNGIPNCLDFSDERNCCTYSILLSKKKQNKDNNLNCLYIIY